MLSVRIVVCCFLILFISFASHKLNASLWKIIVAKVVQYFCECWAFSYYSLLQDDNEDINDEIIELRQQLKNTLIVNKPDTSTPINATKDEKEPAAIAQTPNTRKSRSESNHSTTSLDPRGFMKKIMNRVSPNPSPVSSDAELDTTADTTVPSTPKKKHISKKVRKRKPSPQSQKHDNDISKDRSNTVPAGDSPSMYSIFVTYSKLQLQLQTVSGCDYCFDLLSRARFILRN